MMTTTLNDMRAKKKPDPSAEETAAKELVQLAKEQGLSLTGPDGLLKHSTKNVLETALNEEMTEHLGHEKNRAAVVTGTGTGQVVLQGGTPLASLNGMRMPVIMLCHDGRGVLN